MKTSKKDKVLKHLKTHKLGITQLQATERYGALRLSSIIYDLKNRDGYNILTNMVEVKDRYGNTCNVARYVLVGDKK